MLMVLPGVMRCLVPVRAVSQNCRFAGFACLPYSCPCACEADGITTTDTLGGPLMPVCARVWVLVDRDTRRHDMRVPTGSHFVIEFAPVGWWGAMASHGVPGCVGLLVCVP